MSGVGWSSRKLYPSLVLLAAGIHARSFLRAEMDKFFSEAARGKGKAPEDQKEGEDVAPKKFPKGVVLGKDGKP